MDKKMIKEFAVWARKKLISDITMKAALYGIRECATDDPLPQSTEQAQFFDIGAKEPVVIQGREIAMRRALVGKIHEKEKTAGYATAFRAVMEEISYTWFNRLTAVRFMEASGYLPSGVRVLSSNDPGKLEPDMVTTPFETDMDFTDTERALVWKLKDENRQNALFCMLFIKQCNKLNEILPGLFEKSDDYSELLLEISFSDKEGIVYRLTHDIAEEDFNAGKGGQVEIIGWLYQFYNSEPKDETYALLKKNVKVTKERLPAVTQLFTPDWIVRYMAENSLGRLWLEGHLNETLKSEWKYYLEEAKQEPEAAARLAALREERKDIRPEEIKLIDPCMGSGHILVYAFDLLMRIYESAGWSAKEAARGILENNLYGLDIDDRAAQLAYFAVMMKARQYDRRIFSRGVQPNVYSIRESASVAEAYQDTAGDFPLAQEDRETLAYLLKAFADAKEYGSIIRLEKRDYQSLAAAWREMPNADSASLWYDEIKKTVPQIIEQAIILTQKYDVVITNPPYMGGSGMNEKLSKYVKDNYPDSKSDLFTVFIEKCAELTRKGGYQAMITQHAWMFLSSYEKLRAKILADNDIVNMAHLGPRAFEEIGGEVVQSTSFIIRKSYTEGYAGRYARLIEPTTQRGKEEMFLRGENRFTARQDNFSKIPGSPVAYWASEKFVRVFDNPKISNFAFPVEGIKTGENERYLRFWFEVNSSLISKINNYDSKLHRYCFTTKGGEYRKWYGNIEYVMLWENNGIFLKAFEKSSFYKETYLLMEATTWTYLTSGDLSFRYLGLGYFYNNKGPAVFAKTRSIALYIASLMNSKVGGSIQNFLNPTLTILPGNIRVIPFNKVILQNNVILKIAERNVILCKSDWDSFETSWDFKTHPLIAHNSNGRLATAFENWRDCAEKHFYQLKANEEELNRIFIGLYGLDGELTPEVEEKEVTVRKADLARDVKSLISYAVGCLFGRYSLDCEGLAYAGGEWKDSIYRRIIPDKDNCLPLTDEEYFHDDVVSLFCKWLAAAFGEKTLEENLDFVAGALGGGGDSRRVIRGYFLKDFFKDHCKIYQKRPLYWLFDSGKENGFKALVYMHRWNADTIGNLRVEYLHPLQVKYENQIAIREQTIANAKEAREKTVAAKEMEKLKKQLKEIKDYDTKVAHLALSRITIDLDDGVKVNYEKVQTSRDGEKLEVLAKI